MKIEKPGTASYEPYIVDGFIVRHYSTLDSLDGITLVGTLGNMTGRIHRHLKSWSVVQSEVGTYVYYACEDGSRYLIGCPESHFYDDLVCILLSCWSTPAPWYFRCGKQDVHQVGKEFLMCHLDKRVTDV